VAPAAALIGLLVYFSVGYTVWLSTQQWNGFGPDRVFIGFANYIRVFDDPVYWRSMVNVAGFLLLILVQMLAGLILAVLLHSRVVLGGVYRIAIFVPVVLAPATMAPIFREIFSPNGQVNWLLRAVGLDGLTHAWLADPATAIFALATIAVWGGTGFSFILYYAGLTQLDPQVFEAARVDGAGNGRIFRSIIVPAVRGTHLTLLVLGTIFTIKLFDVPQLITGGGPANATQFPATHIYQAGVTNYDAGYGAALTVTMVVICLALAAWQLRWSARSEGES
jgi:raffinose/stachyose/melibiose transport system permease protein